MATTTEDPKYGKTFTEVETERQEALTDLENTYGGLADKADQYFQKQIDASKEWAETQKTLQQEQTDFAIDKIEQQKAQAQKDYTKEQSGAYVDWQKQSNRYGVNAEQMAENGMTNTGYAESSQVSMYNTYQNRVTAARESYNLAVLNYDNAIKEAQLQNNSVLAEIAYQALQTQLELSIQGLQYKNQLVMDMVGKKMQINTEYNNLYQQVLAQLNTEKAQALNERQVSLAEQQFAWQKERAAAQAAAQAKIGTGRNYKTGKGVSDAKGVNHVKTSKRAIPKDELLHQVKQNATSYDKAVAFMKNNGISDGGQRLLTSAEWSKAKRQGQLGSELEYSNYREYVFNYLTWRINES